MAFTRMVVRNKGMFTKEVREISTRKIADRLMMIMREHIGYAKGIVKTKLFRKIFSREFDDNSSSCWILWEFTKKAMHLLRVRSNCFIANTQDRSGQYRYFIIADDNDADFYIKQLENNIRKMKLMQQRAARAAREHWHLQDWAIAYVPRKKLINAKG